MSKETTAAKSTSENKKITLVVTRTKGDSETMMARAWPQTGIKAFVETDAAVNYVFTQSEVIGVDHIEDGEGEHLVESTIAESVAHCNHWDTVGFYAINEKDQITVFFDVYKIELG